MESWRFIRVALRPGRDSVMIRTSRNIAAGVDTIHSFSSTSSSLLTLQHDERADHQVENNLGFEEFAAAIHEELAPEGVLEHLLVDRVSLAAWHLLQSGRAEAAAIEKTARRRGEGSSRPARSQALAAIQGDAFG